MTESRKLLIGAVKEQYLFAVRGIRGSGGLHEAFASWILGIQHETLLDLEAAVRVASGASRTYREVAVLGYAAALSNDASAIRKPLAEGLEWLAGRVPFAQPSPSFEIDGTALLGIALGAEVCGDDKIKKWMGNFLKRSAESRVSPWDRGLIAAAMVLSDNQGVASLSSGSELADLRVALASRGVAGLELPNDCEHAMHQVLQELEVAQDASRSAVRIRVLDWLSYETSLLTKERLTVEDVCRLLERVPMSMKRWRWDDKIRWKIENEYHVQDLLWIILAPLFADLEDEENLPSLGHKHPRCDLGIPSLHLIIEVKFIRKGTQSHFARITEEIAADHTLYTTAGSNYNKIVAFVWDDSRSSEQHFELKQGLQKMPGIVGTVIVSRPAKMVERD
jgi:hypothetical protein